MDAFFTSALAVTLAEMGDKTQLLCLLLAARLGRPLTLMAGIACATLLNHALAAWLGSWWAGMLPAQMLRYVTACAFLLAGVWALFPDKLEENTVKATAHSVFFTSFIMFFMAEMGDKTQLATVMLAAQYQALFPVMLGTTLGMLLANAPCVFFGERILRLIPLRLMRWLAAGMFLALALASALNH